MSTERTENQDNQEQETPAFVIKVANDTNQDFTEQQQEIIEESQEQEQENSQEQEQPVEENQQIVQEVILDDEKVIAYLKEKGLTAESIEDLKPKEAKKLSAEGEKFSEFHENTGRGMTDFLEIQKDWSKEDADLVIKKQMALDYPMLTSQQIDFRFNKKFGIDGLDEDDDSDEIQERTIEKSVEHQKALKSLEKQKEEYMIPVGDEKYIPEPYKEAKAVVDRLKKEQEEGQVIGKELRDKFVAVTEQIFADNSEGFKFKVDGDEVVIKPSKEDKALHLDASNFDKKHFDKDGNLKDPTAYHLAFKAAMNPEAFAEHFYKLGKAAQVEADDKLSKNIQVGGSRKLPPAGISGITVKKA